MKEKIFKIVIFSICAVFFATIVATGCILYSDYKTGVTAAQTRFEKLFEQTQDALSKTGQLDDEFFKAFNKAVGSPEYYYSITLKNADQEVYVYPALNSTSQQKTYKPFTVIKSGRITEDNYIDLNLTVSIYTLPASILYSRFKVAFIIILGATLASVLCLMYLYLNSSETSDNSDASEDFNDTEELNFSDDNLENNLNEVEFSSNDKFVFEDGNLHDDESFKTNKSESLDIQERDEDNFDFDDIIPTPENISTSDNTENISETEITDAENTISTTADTTQNQIDENKNTNDNKEITSEPSTNTELFSEVTGFCCEKYLTTRLDSELARSASGELDISIILIQISEVTFSHPCSSNICNLILNIFHYKDMVFEYKNDGLAIIFSNADIDRALEISEQIFAEICSILNQANVNAKPLFGIASRSLRFISGENLLIEAEQALLHAKEDPESPIIAFRVNPEKYRSYIAQKH